MRAATRERRSREARKCYLYLNITTMLWVCRSTGAGRVMNELQALRKLTAVKEELAALERSSRMNTRLSLARVTDAMCCAGSARRQAYALR